MQNKARIAAKEKADRKLVQDLDPELLKRRRRIQDSFFYRPGDEIIDSDPDEIAPPTPREILQRRMDKMKAKKNGLFPYMRRDLKLDAIEEEQSPAIT